MCTFTFKKDEFLLTIWIQTDFFNNLHMLHVHIYILNALFLEELADAEVDEEEEEEAEVAEEEEALDGFLGPRKSKK